ncbi:SGT1-domain-containing protein [Biscogniauxia marginata]|nr:SGT1-domain-containing protein [Biscogniauxia marginata]
MDSEDRTEFFQDGFDGFPRRLPDNCVEYMLFLIDSKIDARALLAELENVRRAAIQLCSRIASEYIWQRDSFQLQVKRDNDLVYLHGTTDYGDSVEDEWLIVYLLRELAKSFPSLWVRVFDSDGEFLLVEAANVLPKWLSPEIDSNRVWIHQGNLQVLPLSASSGEKRPLSLGEAVRHIKSRSDSLLHSTFIEAEAFYRLEKYPAQITDSIHHSVVTIPRKLAYLLHEQPTAIAPAVEAFYLRDPIAMKPLASLSGNLNFPPNDLVTISVKFTKVLFAQLKSQRFGTPPIWGNIVESAEEQDGNAEGSQKTIPRLEMGMKVTSGFEMLAASVDRKDNRLAREFAIVLEDLKEDGEQVLPSNEDIERWPGVDRDDDESWLDINFEDFENELQGQRGTDRGAQNGFGNSSAQADLRKIVSRFEAFLNDETAGMDGAEMEDMDQDDDLSDEDGDEDEDDNEDEDKAVSFDEDQFSRMMREMMGLPPEEPVGLDKAPKPSGQATSNNTISKISGVGSEDDGGESDEDKDIQRLAAQMEAELKELGALKLDPQTDDPKALRTKEASEAKGKGKAAEGAEAQDEESGDEEVDIDYNLAKNLLESFKSQAGMAGPASNILGMMGMQLPRDEDEEDDK